MKKLLLALLLLLGFLLVSWSVVKEAVDRNLVALELLQSWSGESKNLSQTICEENLQQVVATESVPLPQGATNEQQALIIAARKAYYSGDCEEAFAYWKRVSLNDPQDRTAASMQYLSSGLDEAFFPEGISPAQMSAFLYGLGLQAEQDLAADQAGYWFANSFKLQPSRAAADRLLAFQPDPDEQEIIWRRLADTLAEDDPNYWWALGQYSELEQDWDRALQAYAEGTLIAPKPYDFLIRQGEIYGQMEAWDRAVAAYRMASDQNPHDTNPYIELGHIYRQQGELKKAETFYEEALAQSPDNFTVIYFLGLVQYQLEDDAQARYYLQRALDLKPAHAASAYYLAQTLKRSGEFQAALESLERAIDLKDDKPWKWLVELGDWRYADGNSQNALDAYKEALEHQPTNAALLDKVKELEGKQ